LLERAGMVLGGASPSRPLRHESEAIAMRAQAATSWRALRFTKNRDRLLDGDVAREFLSEVVNQAQEQNLTSNACFQTGFSKSRGPSRAWRAWRRFEAKHVAEAVQYRSPDHNY
jgi:predicted ATPase with chaperone activity